MELKHLISLNLLAIALTGGLLATVYIQRARDLAFLVLVSAAVVTDRLDVHFVSLEWYRGTTRGFEVSLLDVLAVCLLVSSLVAPRYAGRRLYWPASLGLITAYALYAMGSAATSHPHLFGWFEASKILRGIIFFLAAAYYVRTRRELALLVLGLCFAVGLEGVLVLREQFLEHAYRVTGTLGHPNSLSMYLCTATPMLVAASSADFPRWLRRLCLGAAALAAIAVVLTLSRAGLPIFAVAVLGAAAWSVSWRITFRKVAAALIIAGAVAAVANHYWAELRQRYEQDTLAEEYLDDTSTAEGRGAYLRWAQAIVHDHFFGVGLNNWSYWVAKTYGPEAGFPYEDYDDLAMYTYDRDDLPDFYLPAPAHNLGALTLGELGIPGFVLFSLLWLRWFQAGAGFLRRRSPDPSWRMGMGVFFALVGLFLQSLTEWTFRQTAIFVTAHVLLGTLAALKNQQRLMREAATAEAAPLSTPAAASVRAIRPEPVEA